MESSVLSSIGNTPLVRLSRVMKDSHIRLYAKLESFNPGGSIKDRAAVSIITHAMQSGRLKPGATVIESSSGNMGIGLAQACAYHGLRFVCVVDTKTTSKNVEVLKAYGAQVEIISEPDPVTGDARHPAAAAPLSRPPLSTVPACFTVRRTGATSTSRTPGRPATTVVSSP